METNPPKGSIALVFKEERPTEKKLGGLAIASSLYAVTGPLGNPALPKDVGSVVCIGYELGIAHVLSVARYLQKKGNKNFGIVGASTKRNLIMESQMRLCCQSISVMTQDGTIGKKGFVTDALEGILSQYPINQIFVAGPTPIIQEVISIAARKNGKVMAVLQPFALSGIAFCGTDEIKVGNDYVGLSTEGLIFDAESVDFKIYDTKRVSSYEQD